MKAKTEIANRLTELIEKAETPYELASVVDTMVECYSTPVIIAALMSAIVDLKDMSFDEPDLDEDEVDSSHMA